MLIPFTRLPELTTGLHELTITLDRKDRGAVNLFLDGKLLANKTISTVASPKIAQEIWFNAQNWSTLDTGFRGTLKRLTMYADSLSPEDVAMPIGTASFTSSKISKLTASMHTSDSTSSPWAILFPCVALLLLHLYILRRRKSVLFAVPEYASRLPELATSLPVVFGRISELAMNDLPAFAKTVPDRAMELVEGISWMKELKTRYQRAATEDEDDSKEAAAEDDFGDTEAELATAEHPKDFE